MIFTLIFFLVLIVSIWSIFKRPTNALVVMYCMFAFEQWAQLNSQLFQRYSYLMNVLAGSLVLIAFGLSILKKNKMNLKMPLGGWLVIFLFLYASLSIGWSPIPALGLELWAKAVPYLMLGILIVPSLIKDELELEAVYRNLVISGGLIVGVLLYTAEWTTRRVVIGDETGNPLELATLSGIVIILGLLSKKRKGLGLATSLMEYLAMAVAIIVIIKTGTRGQLFALLLVFCLIAPLRFRLTNALTLISVAIIVSMAVMLSFYVVGDIWSDSNRWSLDRMQGDLELRFSAAGILISEWSNNVSSIIFGLGNSASYDNRLVGFYIHNVPIEILTEEGLVGAILFLTLMAWLLRCTYKKHSIKHGQGDQTHVRWMSAALLLYFLMLSLKQGSLIGSHTLFMSIMVYAKIIGGGRKPISVKNKTMSYLKKSNESFKKIR